MKKKVGIMSMQRIVNYGSFLQAYGLKNTIEELGYDVQFVDYNYEKKIDGLREKTLLKKIRENVNVFGFIKKKRIIHKFRNKYRTEYIKLLGIEGKNYNPKIDKLVIGSDEVFNCLQDYPVGYSRELFGKNYENIDVVSYAASFGHSTLKELKEHKLDNEIAEMLKKFKSISVRDQNSYKIVKSLTGREPFLHLDPVLISNYDKDITDNVELKDYIVVYAYTGRLTKQEEKYIKRFAKKYAKKIVCLGMYQRIADYNLVVSPLEVLEYIKKADYVITDTFHGTIFSVVNHTKFCTMIRESNKNKLKYLLDKLKLNSRMVNKIENIDRLYHEDIDYKETDCIILDERKKTIEYLKKNLG